MKYQDESTKVSIVSVSRVRRLATAWAVDAEEPLVVLERRFAGRQELDVSGSRTGSSDSGDRDDAVVGAVDDRDRAAPVALAADQPVRAGGTGRRARRRLSPTAIRWPRSFAVSTSSPSRNPLLIIVPGPDAGAAVEVLGRLDGANDRQAVGGGELEVAFVLGGDRHDRPGAVGREDVVGDVDRDRARR